MSVFDILIKRGFKFLSKDRISGSDIKIKMCNKNANLTLYQFEMIHKGVIKKQKIAIFYVNGYEACQFDIDEQRHDFIKFLNNVS